MSWLRQMLLGLAVALVSAGSASAHTLPISYLIVTSDKDYFHLELTLNPFELNFAAELDDNGNGALDRAEIQRHKDAIAKSILKHISLTAGNKKLAAENYGVVFDDQHHLILGAHFKKTAAAIIELKSDLNAITSASHIVQVTYGAMSKWQFAQLDTRTPNLLLIQEQKTKGH